MTSTPLDTGTAPEVLDLDAAAVLDAADAARRTADRAEARLLALAVHLVDLHPVTPEHPAATFPTLGAIYALSYLSGLVMPLAPAGLGVREGLMALLLSQLMPVPAAAAASVLVRVLQVAAEGLCAAVFSRV